MTDIGMAVEALRKGKMVTRARWPAQRSHVIKYHHERLYIAYNTAGQDHYVPTAEDMMANDWVVYEADVDTGEEEPQNPDVPVMYLNEYKRIPDEEGPRIPQPSFWYGAAEAMGRSPCASDRWYKSPAGGLVGRLDTKRDTSPLIERSERLHRHRARVTDMALMTAADNEAIK